MLEAAKAVQIYTGIISEFGLVNAAANTQGYPPEENPLSQAGTRLDRGSPLGTASHCQRLKAILLSMPNAWYRSPSDLPHLLPDTRAPGES